MYDITTVNKIIYFYYRSGAAIVVETQDVLSVFDRHFHNPLCFLQYYDPSVPVSEISHDNVCLL